MTGTTGATSASKSLYTKAQKARRDSTVWTVIQGVLAPLQFAVFLVSLVLVFRYLSTGEGYLLASGSILVKTGFLYLIMVTGAIWEKVVFGQWLFAPAFFWEDVFSFAVIALHTLYIYGFLWGQMAPMTLMVIALAAYAAYVLNAGQFLWKLRRARQQHEAAA
ncbi:MAG: 2-vinyl bacteriochlorophyllide hydratase [Pseudomonadota bacterium]